MTGPFSYCCSACLQNSSVHSRRCRRRHEALVAQRARGNGGEHEAVVPKAAAVEPIPFLDQMD